LKEEFSIGQKHNFCVAAWIGLKVRGTMASIPFAASAFRVPFHIYYGSGNIFLENCIIFAKIYSAFPNRDPRES